MTLLATPHPQYLPGDNWDEFWLRYLASCQPLERMTIAKQDVALAAYGKVGTLKAAMEACGLTYDAGWMWNQRDTHYWRRRLELAKNQHADYLEQMMLQRLEDPKGNRGSDILLMFNLKAKRPDTYREASVILGSDASRDIQERLLKIMAADVQRRQAVTVEATETVEAEVTRVLGPRRAPDTKAGEVLDKS